MPSLDARMVRSRRQLEGTGEALKDIYLGEFKIVVFTDQVSEAWRFYATQYDRCTDGFR
ncbi:MAG: hypothetical protein QXO55_03030 [Candidatus Korarchaeum sp.]